MSAQIKFGLKNDVEFVYSYLNKKREFYLVVQNFLGYNLPQVRVIVDGPEEIKILIRSQGYGEIGNRHKKSRKFLIIPKTRGIFNLTATLKSRKNILLTLPIEVRVGNLQFLTQSSIQQGQTTLQNPIRKINCVFCGEHIDSDVNFCPTCGSKIDGIQKEENGTKTCLNCGFKLLTNTKFCAKCGFKID
ncbi:MAG: zinc ribbon domain-containing protein [Promethearchaeota archaeon]